ncbi:predicted protein, partial [Nematostella vectensis]
RVFRRRFYILFLFSIISFAQYCAWNTYGPIATTAKTVFDWSNTEIAVLASMDPITYLVTMLFFSWMMDVKGLRKSMLVSTAFMFVGTGLRCVTPDSTYAIWTMGGGQLLNGLAGPVTQAAPPLLSAAWFPSHQRTTATAVAALCGSLGVAMSFVIGPAFVTDLSHTSPTSSECSIRTGVEMTGIATFRSLFGVITVLFLAVVIYFPDKPPLPPSHSARIQREDFFAGTKRIVKNSSFWTLALVYGITTGVYSGWGASLAVNLETFNVSQSAAGWLGFYATLAGIGAGLILARCADLFGGRMKAILVVLFFGSSGCFLWFALLCLRKIPYDSNSLYKSSIMGGFFVSGTIPLFYELTVESTYPVAEGVTCGLLTLVNNFFTVAFLVILTIPGVGTVWMNWCMFGACAAGIPIMLSFREKYRRLNID